MIQQRPSGYTAIISNTRPPPGGSKKPNPFGYKPNVDLNKGIFTSSHQGTELLDLQPHLFVAAL